MVYLKSILSRRKKRKTSLTCKIWAWATGGLWWYLLRWMNWRRSRNVQNKAFNQHNHDSFCSKDVTLPNDCCAILTFHHFAFYHRLSLENYKLELYYQQYLISSGTKRKVGGIRRAWGQGKWQTQQLMFLSSSRHFRSEGSVQIYRHLCLRI